jgi:Icc-related predicted phosphoesterase
LHCLRARPSELAHRLFGVEQYADVLLLCGDMTDTGDPHEARLLAQELRRIAIPIVGVLGNHDYERGAPAELCAIFASAGVRLLDGEATTVGDLGIAGVKGFGGGFGRRRVAAFGEPATKRWVEEGRYEAEKLEAALRSLETPRRVAITHYTPTLGTAVGEAPEIIPFLGSSDLAAAADRAGADAMFHGHCHFGRAQAKTDRGIPVFNCAAPVLDHLRPPRRFVIVELALGGSVAPRPHPPAP